MSYRFLSEELAKRSVTQKELSECLGLQEHEVACKMERGAFSIEEAAMVQAVYASDIPLRKLFKRE